ncbi:MAG: hypothetical protein KGL12_11170 [Rhodospirillales bacterium]|nr:hypothetical protein [Rhodospirillales bacterium]
MFLLGLSGTALAAAPAKDAPRALGTFADWTAATHGSGKAMVCYAFTRASDSAPAIPHRGAVLLSVTEREGGRDEVTLSAGYPYAKDAAPSLQVDTKSFDLYTAGDNAFARDGHAAVAAFQRGSTTIAHGTGPRGQAVVDTFSLKGFSAAYAAIVKACPPARK